MELRLPKRINKFFWILFPFIFVLNSFLSIFYDWEFQNYQFNELEDFGSLLFALGISACESALIVVFIWLIISFIKTVLGKPVG